MRKRKTNRISLLQVIGIVFGVTIFTLLLLSIKNYLENGNFTFLNAATQTIYIDKVFTKVSVKKNIKYGEAKNGSVNEALLLDLYEPSGDKNTKRPVIIFVHGGGFIAGSKDASSDKSSFANEYAKTGYVVLPINYRLTKAKSFSLESSFITPAVKMAKEDTLAAVRWVKANASTYKLDPNKIVVMGNSAGAMTALYSAYDSANVGSSGNPNVSSSFNAAVSMSGGMLSEDISKIQKGEPPALLFHGESDSTVPVTFSKKVSTQLKKVGITYEAYYYKGLNHDLTSKTSEIKLKTLTFLAKVLNLNTTQPPTNTDTATITGRYQKEVFKEVEIQKNIEYGKAGNKSLALDMYQPKGDSAKKRAVIVLVHGGGFVGGSKEVWAGESNYAAKLTKIGYVVLANNYRLLDNKSASIKNTGEMSDAVKMAKEDTMAAIRWARANATKYNLDKDKIVVGGSSAGAITSMYTAYDTDDVGNSGNPSQSSTVQAAFSLAGGMFPGDYNKIEKGEPPSALFHGLSDGVVPSAFTKSVENQLKAVNIAHVAYYYPGVGHGVKYEPDVIPRLTEFLYSQLKFGTLPPLNTPPDDTPPINENESGDANGDGKVDSKDLQIWKKNRNKTTTNGATDGDFNLDGKVDLRDLFVWIKARK